MKYLVNGDGSLTWSNDAGQFADHRKPHSESRYRLEISRRKTLELYTNCYCCCFPSQPIPLYKYHDAPDFLHGNPFVIHGYRGKLPLVLCLQR